jgi:hypothetical protein
MYIPTRTMRRPIAMVAVVDDASSDHCELYSEIRIIGHLVAAENVNTFFQN